MAIGNKQKLKYKSKEEEQGLEAKDVDFYVCNSLTSKKPQQVLIRDYIYNTQNERALVEHLDQSRQYIINHLLRHWYALSANG